MNMKKDQMHFRKLGSKQQRIEGWRQKFLTGIQSAGLEMEDVRMA